MFMGPSSLLGHLCRWLGGLEITCWVVGYEGEFFCAVRKVEWNSKLALVGEAGFAQAGAHVRCKSAGRSSHGERFRLAYDGEGY